MNQIQIPLQGISLFVKLSATELNIPHPVSVTVMISNDSAELSHLVKKKERERDEWVLCT